MRWVEHVARMGENKKVYKFFLWESPKERHHSEDGGVDRRMDENRTQEDWAGVCGVDSVGSG
jgi:hypothetical protein